MTIAQLIDLLRSYGVDILILGAADALLTALIGKIPEKILPKKYLTFIPFLLGFLLYALFFPLIKNLSAEDFSVVLERGFGVGLTAILCNLLFARLTGKKDGTERSRLARKTAPQRLHKGACPYGSGRKNLGGVFRGNRRDRRRRKPSGRHL